MNEVTVEIYGIPHTIQVTDEEAKRLGAHTTEKKTAPKKPAAPREKSRTPRNKAAKTPANKAAAAADPASDPDASE